MSEEGEDIFPGVILEADNSSEVTETLDEADEAANNIPEEGQPDDEQVAQEADIEEGVDGAEVQHLELGEVEPADADSGAVVLSGERQDGGIAKAKPFACNWPDCGKSFQWKSYLERHAISHTGLKPEPSARKKREPRKKKTQNGEEAETGKPKYTCSECGKEFSWKSYLERHAQTHSGIKPFECDYPGCEYRTGQTGNLKMHKQTHSGVKPHACNWPECTYRSTHPGNLKNHMLTHTGEKRFKCPVMGCEYSAIQYETLNQHVRTHTGEKPFKCPWEGCSYAGRQSATLKVHYLTHTGDKPYACSWPGCEYRSTHSGHVKKHYLGHTGEKPHACDVEDCTYRASTTGALEVHKKSHSGIKPYFCMVPNCTFASIQSGSLKRHSLTHTGVKPYACEHCVYRAAQPGTLKRHIGNHHVFVAATEEGSEERASVAEGAEESAGEEVAGSLEEQPQLQEEYQLEEPEPEAAVHADETVAESEAATTAPPPEMAEIEAVEEVVPKMQRKGTKLVRPKGATQRRPTSTSAVEGQSKKTKGAKIVTPKLTLAQLATVTPTPPPTMMTIKMITTKTKAAPLVVSLPEKSEATQIEVSPAKKSPSRSKIARPAVTAIMSLSPSPLTRSTRRAAPTSSDATTSKAITVTAEAPAATVEPVETRSSKRRKH
ncbi:putative Zinc finger protein 180 [Hypsibius exemplaris]|uniref:Zinc finger protein 180 n=1 Tax=Hypsibius exemplaris TaxID=2072580 RepID=A0A1W0XF49_HYPEX|nr:putative Zinc finger protein 180 [Hypsibius exemplaris]